MEDGARVAPDLDEDALYRTVGRFVVSFQALESCLASLASFALDPERGGWVLPAIGRLGLGQLVGETEAAVGRFLEEHREAEPEFRERLRELLARCRELATLRNRVVHSAYVFLESGDRLLGVVRSDAARGDGDDFDRELLTEASFQATLAEMAEVGFGVAQCQLQLIAWYRPEVEPAPGATPER